AVALLDQGQGDGIRLKFINLLETIFSHEFLENCGRSDEGSPLPCLTGKRSRQDGGGGPMVRSALGEGASGTQAFMPIHTQNRCSRSLPWPPSTSPSQASA